MYTWFVASSHFMVSVPPSITISTVRPVRPVRWAATAVAQAPVPQACVMPDPLSHTRIRILFSPVICANSTFVRSGKSGCFSSFGPISGRSILRISSTKVTRCGFPTILAWRRMEICCRNLLFRFPVYTHINRYGFYRLGFKVQFQHFDTREGFQGDDVF